MKYAIELTKQYLKDLKQARKRGLDENKLNEAPIHECCCVGSRMRLCCFTNTGALTHEYGFVNRCKIVLNDTEKYFRFLPKKDSNLMQDMQAPFNYLNIR